jgi:hypothetical protein
MVSDLALATLPAPTDVVRHQLPLVQVRQRLHALTLALAQEPDDLNAVLTMHAAAVVLADYLTSIHAARDLQCQAAECRLRAERRCGELLLRHVRLGNSTTTLWRRSRSGPPRRGRAKLKEGVLAQYGLDSKASSAYQSLAHIPDDVFEGELARRRQQAVPASRSAMLRLTEGTRRPRTTRVTDTSRLLRGALDRLQRVRQLTTQDELILARKIAEIGGRWGAVVFKPREDGPPAMLHCVLCGRRQPVRRCGACSGWFVAEADGWL